MASSIKFRRAISVNIPLFTALMLIGILPAIFGIGISDNLFKTGLTPGVIFAILNFIMFFLALKHRVP